jgi:hypothetical protein
MQAHAAGTLGVGWSVILLLVLASTVIIGFESRQDIFFFLRLLCVFKWGLFFNKRRGLTATGHSSAMVGVTCVGTHSLTGPLFLSHKLLVFWVSRQKKR